MLAKSVVPGLYAVSLGFVNVFLLDTGSGYVLFDSGIGGSGKRILQAIEELGHPPAHLKAVLITHLHQDHIGGLGEIKRATGAKVYMHILEAQDYQKGQIMRPVQPGPGLLNKLVVRILTGGPSTPNTDIVPVDVELRGGETIAEAGGVRAVHAPGHTTGHMVYYWPQHGGVIIAGDIASHMRRLNYSFLYENLDQGRRTLAEVAALGFEVACFSHGGPILQNAAQQFTGRFAAS